jgi:hypothetical protein
MMPSGERPPGGLDLGRRRPGLDPEDVVRVALRHDPMISTPEPPTGAGRDRRA